MDPIDDIVVHGAIVRKIKIMRILAVLLATLAVVIVASSQEARRHRRKQKRAVCPFYKCIIHSNNTNFHDQIHMSKVAFFCLANILRQKGSIQDMTNITLEEQLVMFLHTLGHNFGHSRETLSLHFHKVLKAIIVLHSDYFLPFVATTPPEIAGKDCFDLYFKDCIGSIDGIHMPVTVDVGIQAKYHDRNGNVSQNFLGVCLFDDKFQYILAGWEGFAADSRVLALALSRADPLVVPPGKFYLVDAGYPNVPGFLAPYRCTRYHLKYFCVENPISTPEELFNHRHSSLRNVIERTFGIFK